MHKSFTGFIKLLIILTCVYLTSCNNQQKKAGNKNLAVADSGAVTVLRKMVAQYPDSTGVRLQLATALDSMGASFKALDEINILLQKDSGDYNLWFNKGQFAEHAKDTLQALNAYKKAITIYPSADALLSAANLYAEQKNALALNISKQVKQMSLGREYDANADFISGVYYARTHQQQQAVQSFDACIGNDYTYMEAYIEKGIVYFDARQFDKALEVFRFATTINKLYADAYYWMGRCFEIMQQKDSAVFNFKQSLALDKTIKESHEALHRLGEE